MRASPHQYATSCGAWPTIIFGTPFLKSIHGAPNDPGDQALSPAAWRGFAHRPGGVLTALLLVLWLAFDGHACPLSARADLAPPDLHGCCHDGGETSPDVFTDSSPPSCDAGPCLEAIGHHDATDRRGPPPSNPDESPLSARAGSPPNWPGDFSPPSRAAEILGPPPPQRSRVLRL